MKTTPIHPLALAATLFTIITSQMPAHAKVAHQPEEKPTVDAPVKPVVDGQNKIQIALLLNTSSSMDGLIDQAKNQLWKVVHTFIDAEREQIQKEIQALSKEREAHIADALKKQADSGDKSLDQAMINSPTILVIEDDSAVRTGIVDTLEYGGYRTLQAPDGHVGMEIALKSNYRLLLLDIIMPDPSGYEILAALKKARPVQAVIMLSARGEEQDRVKGLVGEGG